MFASVAAVFAPNHLAHASPSLAFATSALSNAWLLWASMAAAASAVADDSSRRANAGGVGGGHIVHGGGGGGAGSAADHASIASAAALAIADETAWPLACAAELIAALSSQLASYAWSFASWAAASAAAAASAVFWVERRRRPNGSGRPHSESHDGGEGGRLTNHSS